MTLRQNAFMATTAAVLVFALAPNALALDGQAVFDALSAQMKRQGLELQSDAIETSGDNVAIRNLKVTVPGGDDGFQLDEVILEDVAEVANGSYVVGLIAMPSFTQTRDGWSLAFEGAQIEGYYLAGPNDVDPIATVGIYRAIEIGALEVGTNGSTVFKLGGITSSMSPYEPGATLDMEGEVKDFFLDFSKMPEPQVQATMAELGYSQMNGRATATGTWNTETGDMAMQQAITLDDAANLNIDFAIGGYTPQLIAALQEMQKSMEGQSEEAKGFAVLGLMQQIEIANISIELVDDSATNRLLDFAAKKQGTNREGVIAQAKGTLPFALAQLQNPEFAAKVSAAVNAFLDNPNSLKIVAAPASPVPVAQVVASAMSAPQAIIGVLGLNISANE